MPQVMARHSDQGETEQEGQGEEAEATSGVEEAGKGGLVSRTGAGEGTAGKGIQGPQFGGQGGGCRGCS